VAVVRGFGRDAKGAGCTRLRPSASERKPWLATAATRTGPNVAGYRPRSAVVGVVDAVPLLSMK
jgi:hypothetical protein